MAQQSRKRRSKHRGNAAGVIESRGRTSRPQSPDDRKRATRAEAREKRLSKPPTWNSALKKGLLGFAMVLIFLAVSVKGSLSHKLVAAIVPAVLAFGVYVVAIYYFELFMYRRHVAKQQR